MARSAQRRAAQRGGHDAHEYSTSGREYGSAARQLRYTCGVYAISPAECEQIVQITYTSGPAERAAAARCALAPTMPRIKRIAQVSAVGALILFLIYTQASSGNFRIVNLLFSIGVAFVTFASVRFLYPISIIDQCRRQRPKSAQITAQFEERGITIRTDGTQSTLAWSLVQDADIQPPYLHILLERNMALAFPLSAFPDGDADPCLVLIRSHRAATA